MACSVAALVSLHRTASRLKPVEWDEIIIAKFPWKSASEPRAAVAIGNHQTYEKGLVDLGRRKILILLRLPLWLALISDKLRSLDL